VRVNQDCGYRQQSEEGIAYNPLDPTNLLAGMDDERQGRNSAASPSRWTAELAGATGCPRSRRGAMLLS
jgi:hypothetical protein